MKTQQQQEEPKEAVEAKPKPELSEIAIFDEIVKQYSSTARFGWYRLGSAAKEIQDRELWQWYEPPAGQEPFAGWDDYANRRGELSRAGIYRAKTLRTELAFLDEKTATQISLANAKWLMIVKKRLGEKKANTDKFVKAAIEKTEKDYAEYCNEKLPGAAKEEIKRTIKWTVDKSLARIIEQAVRVAMWVGELDDERDGVELMCSDFLSSVCQKEGFGKLSNAAAYARARGRRTKKQDKPVEPAKEKMPKGKKAQPSTMLKPPKRKIKKD